MTYECIDIQQAKSLIDNEAAIVVDIRDSQSYQEGHITDAIHVDSSNITEFIESGDKKRPLIVCCYHGNMSKSAAEHFFSMGFERSYSLNGGYGTWPSE